MIDGAEALLVKLILMFLCVRGNNRDIVNASHVVSIYVK